MGVGGVLFLGSLLGLVGESEKTYRRLLVNGSKT